MYQGENPESKNTIVFLHENAGNIGMRMDWFEYMYKNLEVNLVSVAYRGYSGSEGSPNEPGLIMDAAAAVEFCKKEEFPLLPDLPRAP